MDRVERLIREARPATQGCLSARAEADLARILSTEVSALEELPSAGPVPARHTGRWLGAVAAVVVLALAITGIGLWRPSPVYAATPAMLAITPMAGDAVSVLGDLQQKAATQLDRSSRGQLVTVWWALASEVDETGVITSSVVDPRRRISTIGPDGVTGYTEYAAQPYDAHGNPVADPAAPAVGTKLGASTVDPDDRLFTHGPPSAADEFGRYFHDTLEPYSKSAAVNAFSDIGCLLTERVLSPAQTAAGIGFLATLPDIELLGGSTDRLGRDVVVFAAPVDNDHQSFLMLSADTGAFTASEVIYRGNQRTDIPSPAVIEYAAWDAE